MAIYNADGCEPWNGIQPINTTILNNTFVGTGSATSTWEGLAIRNARDNIITTIKNNIFLNYHHALEDGINIDVNSFTSGGAVTDYNLYYGVSYVAVGVKPDYKFTLSAFQASPHNQEAHGRVGDPLLDSNYRPTANSSALGAGADLSQIFTTDKDGRIRNPPWDMGAYTMVGAIPNAPAGFHVQQP